MQISAGHFWHGSHAVKPRLLAMSFSFCSYWARLPPCFLGLTQSDFLVLGLKFLFLSQLASSWSFSCPLNHITFFGTWFSFIFLKPQGGIETVMVWISPLSSSIATLDQGRFFTLRTWVNTHSTQNNPEDSGSQGQYRLPAPQSSFHYMKQNISVYQNHYTHI